MAGDVMKGNGYVVTENGRIIGYACISSDKEECYETLRGTQKSIQPRGVIHGLAIDNPHEGKGLGFLMLHQAEELYRPREIHSTKIGTDQDNGAMRHLLEKNGYEYYGAVTFDNNDKVAFEKLI